jgi:hypothetical protein
MKCAFIDCDRNAVSKGYCDKHYRRLLKRGDVNNYGSRKVAEGNAIDRFHKKYEINESEIYEEYDVAGKTQIIKDRNVRNQKSMQMAKLKGDKTGEKMFQLKLQIDQIDLQKAKLKGEVSKIQDERKAQRDKIKSLG